MWDKTRKTYNCSMISVIMIVLVRSQSESWRNLYLAPCSPLSGVPPVISIDLILCAQPCQSPLLQSLCIILPQARCECHHDGDNLKFPRWWWIIIVWSSESTVTSSWHPKFESPQGSIDASVSCHFFCASISSVGCPSGSFATPGTFSFSMHLSGSRSRNTARIHRSGCHGNLARLEHLHSVGSWCIFIRHSSS